MFISLDCLCRCLRLLLLMLSLQSVNTCYFSLIDTCANWRSGLKPGPARENAGPPVVFHDTAKSPYSCYELTFHQLLTFIVLFLSYGEQLKSYYATNSRKTDINSTTTCMHRLRLLTMTSRLLSRHILFTFFQLPVVMCCLWFPVTRLLWTRILRITQIVVVNRLIQTKLFQFCLCLS